MYPYNCSNSEHNDHNDHKSDKGHKETHLFFATNIVPLHERRIAVCSEACSVSSLLSFQLRKDEKKKTWVALASSRIGFIGALTSSRICFIRFIGAFERLIHPKVRSFSLITHLKNFLWSYVFNKSSFQRRICAK